MALYMQAFAGMSPIGNVQAGVLATLMGAPWAMGIGATVAGLAVLGVQVVAPEVFGPPQPTKTSSTEATASAGTSQRSART
jgi:hypothetical protein